MTDNSFRDELGQLPPGLTLGATSEQIMRRGRRIRTIRQGSIAGLAALAVVGSATAVAVGVHRGSQTVHAASGGTLGGPVAAPALVSPAPASSTPAPASTPASSVASAVASSALPMASSATPSSAVTCAPAAQSELGAPAPNTDGNPPAWGTVIPAGTQNNSSVVLYGVHVSDAQIPCTHFGLMLGTTDGSAVTGAYEANEFDGSDNQPGFHAVSSVSGLSQVAGWYVIGYYVGAAASISVDEKQNAAPIAATVVPWSVNPNIKIWWLSGTGAAPSIGTLAAKDAAGSALPTGDHAQVGVG